MNPDELKSILESAFPTAQGDADGDGSHFSVRIVSDDFDGLTAVKRQQKVYSNVDEHIKSGAIHALSIKTYTQSEWATASKLQLG